MVAGLRGKFRFAPCHHALCCPLLTTVVVVTYDVTKVPGKSFWTGARHLPGEKAFVQG